MQKLYKLKTRTSSLQEFNSLKSTVHDPVFPLADVWVYIMFFIKIYLTDKDVMVRTYLKAAGERLDHQYSFI